MDSGPQHISTHIWKPWQTSPMPLPWVEPGANPSYCALGGPLHPLTLVLLFIHTLKPTRVFFLNEHQGYCKILIVLLRNSMLLLRLSEESILKISCMFCLKNCRKYVSYKANYPNNQKKRQSKGIDKGWLVNGWHVKPFTVHKIFRLFELRRKLLRIRFTALDHVSEVLLCKTCQKTKKKKKKKQASKQSH